MSLTHRSVTENDIQRIQAIDGYIAHHNTNQKPFIWTKTARNILQKAISANSRLSNKQNVTLCPPVQEKRWESLPPGLSGARAHGQPPWADCRRTGTTGGGVMGELRPKSGKRQKMGIKQAQTHRFFEAFVMLAGFLNDFSSAS